MGLSRAVFEAHVRKWSESLRRTNRPYREYWPPHLFRHEPVQTAARILQTGQLLSRNQADREAPGRPDIAAPEVIATTAAAYDKARLYFRPLNPTQYWVEGVRSEAELWSASDQVHAPVLVMLVFDGEPVLTSEGVSFSNGNVQRTTRTSIGNDDRFFLSIDWERVYHDGPWSQDGEAVKAARCAEALVDSPMPLESTLTAVMCRSAAERSMLLHLAGDAGKGWRDRIRVHRKAGIFYSEWAFVESVDAASDHISVSFNPPRAEHVPVRLTVARCSDSRVVVDWTGAPLDLGKRWQWKVNLDDGEYLCRIYLHDCLAYEAPFLIDELPF